MHTKVLVCGGDKRQYMAAQLLKTMGFEVCISGFENIAQKDGLENAAPDAPADAQYILLPAPYKDTDGTVKMPFSDRKRTLADICGSAGKDAVIVYGGADEESRRLFEEYGLQSRDLLADEAYTVRNAWITAQAAVMLAMTRSERALSDSHALVCGYGRIGRTLAPLLRGFCRRVTATARKEKDLEWIRAQGSEAVRTGDIRTIIGGCDFVFNTIPHPVIGIEELSAASKEAVFIELASKPYGIDLDEASRQGLRAHLDSGLPGKCFPRSAAMAVAEAMNRIVRKKDGGVNGFGRG